MLGILRKLLSWTLKLTLLLALIPLGYAAYALIAYRNLPAEQLQAKYGGDNLQYFQFDGTALAYRVHGPLTGEKPVIMLVHSHFLSMRQWDNWIYELGDEFSLVRFDMPGHGLTGPDGHDDYSRARLVALMNALADHLGLATFALAGASTGGAGAWSYAASYPARVKQLVLINAAGMPNVSDTNPWMDMQLPDWGAIFLYLLPPNLFDPFLKRSVHDDALVTPAHVQEFHELYRYPGNRRAEYIRISRFFERDDPAEVLAKITAPVLILWGAENKQLPTAHVEGYKQRLINTKAIETKIYPDIGHAIPWEAGAQSAADVAAFIKNY